MSRRRKHVQEKKLRGLLKICAVFAVVAGVLAVAALGVSFYFNEYELKMSIPAEENIVLEYGEDYDDSDVTAWYCGTIWEKSGIEIDVQRSGEPDVGNLGEYTVTYSASYKGLYASAVRHIFIEDTTPPVILLTSSPTASTNPNSEYEEEGFIASDNYDGDLTDQVIREEKDGVVTYTVEDSSHNVTTVTREITYRDEVAPVIELAGDAGMTLEAGEAFAEPGYTATDDCDGDLTDSVKVNGNVDTNKAGIYELTYNVTDSAGNRAGCTRTVTVADTKAPAITLNGDVRVYVHVGSEYSDPGATAYDQCDGDISDEIRLDNPVDTEKKGVYAVKYTVSDASGNEATAERTVYVYEEKAEEEPSQNEEESSQGDGEKIIYLTFDDGPGKYTEQLLDLLDEYDVKVTFFVTNQYPKYQYLIAEEYKRGHTVAIHSYSHDYSTIYSSESAFYEDIEKMNDIIYEQTGEYATIVRFPGGSSNTVSKKYCEGIMTALTESLGIMGFQYADWNVTSGDAGDTTSTSKVISNVISGIKKHNVSVVLQHDIHGFSVEAVEDIIVWGLENGYTFLAMDNTTQMVHHNVEN